MNLADFPISALQRQQPVGEDGRKLDRVEYSATRYDPVTRQRVNQKVTLTTSSREGLPTPADEHVVLALLCIAKHSHNFAEPTVRFAPGQLFEIMGWAPNGRSYTRLRDVLRRLKSLNIRYENAWWDAAGRGYEEEVATGIISSYRLARQVSGPRKPGSEGLSWVTWTPQFQQSLEKGNIKRLNLELFFRLSTPTAQRMYRFLDKRFYNSPRVVMDLVDFACGHIGLTESDNVAILKRRLAPAIAELEGVNFITRMDPSERYQKVKRGVWRVQFQAAEQYSSQVVESAPAALPAPDAESLAMEFYRQWDPSQPARPGPRDVEQAQVVLAQFDATEARAVVACLVQVTRKGWPDCRSFSGAVQKYLADAVKLHRQRRRREEERREAEIARLRALEEAARQQRTEQELNDAWQRLSEEERAEIRRRVMERLGGATAPEAFLHRFCLQELANR